MATPSPGATKTTKKKKKKKDSTKNADGESATTKKKKVPESPGKTPLLKVIPSPNLLPAYLRVSITLLSLQQWP